MKLRKNISLFAKRIILACVTMTFCATNADAYEIDFRDGGELVIKNIGKSKAGEQFTFNAEPLDSIIIDGVVLTYAKVGQKTYPLSIVADGDTVFNTNVTKTLNKSEIKRANGLVLYTNKNYKITHGDQTWTLQFDEVPPVNPTVNDSVSADTVSTQTGIHEQTADNSSAVGWWVWLIVALAVIELLVIAFFCYGKVKGTIGTQSEPGVDGGTGGTGGNKPKGGTHTETPAEGDGTGGTGGNRPEGGTTTEAPAEIGHNIVETEIPEESVDVVLGRLLPVEDNGHTAEEKEYIIKEMLAKGSKAREDIALICRNLSVTDDTPGYILVEKINQLRPSDDSLQANQDNNPTEELSTIFINEIKDRNNKTLTRLVKNAEEECRASKTPNYDSLMKFIRMLSSQVGSPSSQPRFEVDFDKLMKQSENRTKMKMWAIEMIADKGYKSLYKNNTIDDTFQKIADLLIKADNAAKQPSEQQIIDAAILEKRLTADQKKVLVHHLIEMLNGQITDQTAQLSSSLSLDELLSRIAEKLQTPSSHEEAQEMMRQSNLKVVNEILDSDIKDFDHDTLRDAIRAAMLEILNNKLPDLDADNLKDAMDKLSRAMVSADATKSVIANYGAADINALPAAIKEKQTTDLLKSVGKKVEKLLPGTQFDSVQKLLNALIKLAEDSKVNTELIAGALDDTIKELDKSYVPSASKDVIGLITRYATLVAENERKLQGEISSKEAEVSSKKAEIARLNVSIEEKVTEVTRLSEENVSLMAESDALIAALHSGAAKVMENCSTILRPCSEYEESQCEDIEERLFASLDQVMASLGEYTVPKGTTPVQTRALIQKRLVEELSKENNPVNTVCRYYAYSRLPFMTDTSREYGVTFNRRNITRLFDAIETLYAQFGITLDIPDLFVVGFEEGDFENLTGRTYGDLDNLCQNSRNHFDKIDSNAKPASVVVDVVNVGFTVDGNHGRTTSVLTY